MGNQEIGASPHSKVIVWCALWLRHFGRLDLPRDLKPRKSHKKNQKLIEKNKPFLVQIVHSFSFCFSLLWFPSLSYARCTITAYATYCTRPIISFTAQMTPFIHRGGSKLNKHLLLNHQSTFLPVITKRLFTQKCVAERKEFRNLKCRAQSSSTRGIFLLQSYFSLMS